ncbi:SWI2/SNF2 ISWI-like (AT hook) [Toxoplasma gondii MAS]|uniref:SWI2/SNF2 ISWI-like (AT hook) n=1 Tax=Toxoplasma gondii MAS TaxID=943118 RepID=A0A086QWY5_TOXGO|nr:SWI2/SNF2 ISWI-like (AT hook) [Toxoplasma gondii MAS]
MLLHHPNAPAAFSFLMVFEPRHPVYPPAFFPIFLPSLLHRLRFFLFQGQKECMRYRQFRPTSHRIGRPPTRLSAGGRPGRGHASHLSRSREKNGDALVFPGDEGEEGRSVCWENEEGEERREGRTDGMAFDTARNADGRGGSHKSRRCTGRKRGRPRGGRGRSSTRGLAPTHLTGDSGTGAGLGSGESDRGGEEQELRPEGDENESGREDVREKEEEKDGDEHGKLVA